ncbi:C6 transcription factor [Aspergillus rambellii]|uniref:C6 transcription factor n=1 Tax=Aspergillus rambellii TaxID=308745 RepID=A0A0F8V583_9EURO|nr:C6 transcription factor [Aspergillus rambellii]
MAQRTVSSARSSFRIRACDNCRLRKIKCDKLVPCSSCGALGISCSSAATAPATPEPSRRTQSNEYEQRFHAIQQQLDSIQQTLQQISKTSPTPPGLTVASPAPSPTTVPPFEGKSSFHHETLIARDAALSAVGAVRNGQLHDQVSSALLSLKDSLDSQHVPPQQRQTTQERNPEPQIRETLLPVDLVVAVVIKAQEEFDIQRCWTYLSLAFNMCQTMGLHRSSTTKSDPFPIAETKRHTFWSLYTIDKNISLNIGVTSHFQDHDIDVDLYTPSENPQQRSWDLINLIVVEFAAIQGKVYDQLYSIGASRTTEDKRRSIIQTLSLELMAVRDKLLEIDVSKGLYADSLHGMTACADFIAYSVLTVIYRAQMRAHNAMAISSQCYQAASMALHSHLKCFTYFRDRQAHKQAEYVNWILLYPSFAPFVIVFTHAITTASATDLALLQETVRSLEMIKGISRGSMHLYTICEAFAKTAQVLVDSRQTLTGLAQHQDGSLIMPPGDGPANIALPDVIWPEDLFDSHVDQVDISMFLNDFIVTNRSVMDILNSNYMNDTTN